MVETEVLVSEDISTEVQQIEPRRRDEDDYRMRCTLPYCMVHGHSPTPCLVTWGRLTITKTPVFRDNSEPDRSTEDAFKARKERSSTEDAYKRRILEKHTSEESSSRGEIFGGEKSKVTIEDVSSEEPRNEDEGSFQMEPIIEEEEEEKLPKSPQRKESVVIEELLDDISEGKEKIEEKVNGSNYRGEEARERVHTEADTALRDLRERDLPQRKE